MGRAVALMFLCCVVPACSTAFAATDDATGEVYSPHGKLRYPPTASTSAGGYRDCGGLGLSGSLRATYVGVRGISCAQGKAVIRRWYAGGRRNPAGWSCRTRGSGYFDCDQYPKYRNVMWVINRG